MIQFEIKLDAPVRPCGCGHQPRLILSRGNGMTTHHFECARCGLVTAPVISRRFASQFWRDGQTHPIAELPFLRPTRTPRPAARISKQPLAVASVTQLRRQG